MVDELCHAVERAQRRPDDAQRRLAQLPRDALDAEEREAWEATPAERTAIEASLAE